VSLALGKGRISLSKKVKESVKSAVKFINHFEETAAEIAIRNGFDFVVCGHIHQPANRIVKTDDGEVTYLNSGDWVENCTALEYNQGEWRIHWQEEVAARENAGDEVKARSTKDLFQELLAEFSMI